MDAMEADEKQTQIPEFEMVDPFPTLSPTLSYEEFIEAFEAKYADTFKEFDRLDEEYKKLESYPGETWFWDSMYAYHPDHKCTFEICSEEDRMEMITDCAEKGLAIYNRQHKTDYSFGYYRDLSFHVEGMGTYWIHCNFTAKPDRAPVKDGDFSYKLFFVEVHIDCESSSATCCFMLDGVETKIGCRICPGRICHPASGFTPASCRLGDEPDDSTSGSTELAHVDDLNLAGLNI